MAVYTSTKTANIPQMSGHEKYPVRILCRRRFLALGFRSEENSPGALSRSNDVEGSVDEEVDADVDGANKAVEEVLVVVDHSLERRAANDSERRAGGRKGLPGRSVSPSASASLSSLVWLSVSVPLPIAGSRWSARIDAEWDAMAERISDVGRKVYPAVFIGAIATKMRTVRGVTRGRPATRTSG
jgi:hypothetical protein